MITVSFLKKNFRLLEDIKNTLSDKREIPYDIEHFDLQKFESRKIRSIKEAKGVLKKGQQVLERSLKMAKNSAALTTKSDSLLMRAFYRNEARVLLYPKIYDQNIPCPVEIINAFARCFEIYFIETFETMKYALENPAFIHEKDLDEFLLEMKCPEFKRLANRNIKNIKVVEDFKEIPCLEEVEKNWIRKNS
uniref:Uncharacterized protein n=1 Tax=Panagrolaimus sp. ES5 TaxID=591445 RepID=A0AC34GWJ5_9BILA